MLGVNSKVCYDNKTQTLHIVNMNALKGYHKIEGKYGIEAWCDIEGTPKSILIPEADILFGIKSKFLRNFK